MELVTLRKKGSSLLDREGWERKIVVVSLSRVFFFPVHAVLLHMNTSIARKQD